MQYNKSFLLGATPRDVTTAIRLLSRWLENTQRKGYEPYILHLGRRVTVALELNPERTKVRVGGFAICHFDVVENLPGGVQKRRIVERYSGPEGRAEALASMVLGERAGEWFDIAEMIPRVAYAMQAGASIRVEEAVFRLRTDLSPQFAVDYSALQTMRLLAALGVPKTHMPARLLKAEGRWPRTKPTKPAARARAELTETA